MYDVHQKCLYTFVAVKKYILVKNAPQMKVQSTDSTIFLREAKFTTTTVNVWTPKPKYFYWFLSELNHFKKIIGINHSYSSSTKNENWIFKSAVSKSLANKWLAVSARLLFTESSSLSPFQALLDLNNNNNKNNNNKFTIYLLNYIQSPNRYVSVRQHSHFQWLIS